MPISNYRFFDRAWLCFLVFSSILLDGVEASGTYCLGGGQLAGVIFGTILGTVAVLAVLFLAFSYLRGSRAKSRHMKEAHLDAISNDGVQSQTNFGSNDAPAARSSSCAHPRYDQGNDEEKNDSRYKMSVGQRSANGEKEKLTNNESGTDFEKTPRKFSQNNGDRSSEYRTKRKKSSVFSSWWTQHMSSKRRISHSSESLNSVNEVVRVTLKSRDANGLGFNICGNLRDGIFVKSLSNRGPAKESGNIHTGDRILGVTINFENMVFEDALTVISYASAYPVTLELQKTDTTTSRKRVASGDAQVTPIGTKTLSNSDKGSQSKALFHPLFKSQSIEDVSSFRSMSPNAYSHIFDSADAALEARRSKSLDSESPTKTPTETIQKPKPVLCSLEVIEETPQLLRRSPAPPRKLLIDDIHSMASSASSIGVLNGDRDEPTTPTTITVTAEINAVDCKDEEETIVLDDPYAGLSYEERLQIIRLSYEDVDLSRNTPTFRSDSQMTAVIDDASQKALDDFGKSPSPTLDSFLVSDDAALRTDKPYTTGTSPFSKLNENGLEKQCQISIHDDEAAASAEDDILSMGDSPSSIESSTTDPPMDHPKKFPLSTKNRLSSLTSPSGSSLGASSSESDRLSSSPEQSKRDSGYDGNGNGTGSAGEDEVEKAQYEKLLYFQRQLAKQHEELARLGIHIPIQPTPTSPKHLRPNGQYS